MPRTYQHIQVETTPLGVRTLTLNRPERLNAVNPVLADEIPSALDEAAQEDAVRVVVITGAGRGFCAGLDLVEPAVMQGDTRAQKLDDMAWVGRQTLAVVRCEKPVIAAVNGSAAGAGFGLALAADLRLVSSTAKMTAGYVRRALSPDAGVSYFLPRLVGFSRAADLLMTGRDISAEEAERIGLASQVFPAAEFAQKVADYAAQLAKGPPTALALTKRVLLASADNDLQSQLRRELEYIRVCFGTTDVVEAMIAFSEKRAPKFGA